MALSLLHEFPALWASIAAPGGLRSGLALSPSISLGILSEPKDMVRSTVSKSARKHIAFLQTLIREATVLVNNAG